MDLFGIQVDSVQEWGAIGLGGFSFLLAIKAIVKAIKEGIVSLKELFEVLFGKKKATEDANVIAQVQSNIDLMDAFDVLKKENTDLKTAISDLTTLFKEVKEIVDTDE